VRDQLRPDLLVVNEFNHPFIDRLNLQQQDALNGIQSLNKLDKNGHPLVDANGRPVEEFISSLDAIEIIRRALFDVRAYYVNKSMIRGRGETPLATWARACDLARQVESGVLDEDDAAMELERSIDSSTDAWQALAEYEASFLASRAWLSKYAMKAKIQERAAMSSRLIGAGKYQKKVNRSLRRGDAQTHLVMNVVEGLQAQAAGMKETMDSLGRGMSHMYSQAQAAAAGSVTGGNVLQSQLASDLQKKNQALEERIARAQAAGFNV
jgi:hypothetical protein